MARETASDISRRLATVTLLVGVVALLSWSAPDPRWHGLRIAGSGVHPLTAVNLTLGSLALWVAIRDRSRRASMLSASLAGIVALLGLARLGADLPPWPVRLDQMLVRSSGGGPNAVQMASTTGLCSLLIGVALLLLRTQRPRLLLLRQSLCVAVAAIAMGALLGFAYQTSRMHGHMAVVTSASLLCLSIAVLWVRPRVGIAAVAGQQSAAGSFLRRVSLPLFLLPVTLGWLHLVLQQGGFADDAASTGAAVTVCVLGMAGLTLWGAVRVGALEEARREADEYHRILFDASPMPAWVYDLETLRFLAVNEAAIRSYGHSREEFLAMSIADIRPKDEVPRLMEHIRDPLVNKSQSGAWWHLRKNGEQLQVEITSRLMSFAGRPGRLVLANDVSARLRIEAALRDSEERFRVLALTANDAIISANRHGEITYLNPATERMFGLEAADAIGCKLTILMPESMRAAHLAGMARHLESGTGALVGRTVELIGLRSPGEEFPIELSLASWESPDGLAFTGVIRDITRRKVAEEEVRQKAAELAAANTELDAFAYSVSHDLRAPLRSIDGFSQALAEDCATRLDEEGHAHLRRIRRAAQKMGTLIDDLLVLSRLTRAPMVHSTIDLSAMAMSILEELRSRDPSRRVHTDVTPGMTALGDGALIRVALENLLANAWKYTRNSVEPRIRVGWREESERTIFFVEDNGAGFDMRYVDKLFVPFQRLHPEVEFDGTGIGLATVARVIRRHGGSVWATGEPGQGATVSFSLESVVMEGASA